MRLPLDERAAFRVVLNRLGRVVQEYEPFVTNMQEKMNEEVIQAARMIKPKGAMSFAKARTLLSDSYIPIKERYEREVDAWVEEWQATKKRHKDILKDLATRVPPQPGLREELFESVWVSTYSTQGPSGASRYAAGRAEIIAEEVREYGIQSEVRRTVAMGDSYEVIVMVAEELDIQILRYAPAKLTLKEWVRRCWAKGVNPRVYNPWLPHGFEEKAGLDYFGGELGPNGERVARKVDPPKV